jgi:MinD superfamily P-loop ATPase
MAAIASPDVAIADCDVDASDMHLVTSPDVKKREDFHGLDIPLIDPEKCTKCGICREACKFGAFDGDINLVEDRCEGCGVCELVCPEDAITMEQRLDGEIYLSETRFGPMVHAALKAGGEGSGKLVSMVRDRTRKKANETGKDLVIVDGPPGIGCPVISSITGADLAVIVTEPTVSGISDLKRIIEVTSHFKVGTLCIINKWDLNTKKRAEIESFMKQLDIPVVGKLPYRTDFNRSQIEKRTLYETADEEIRNELGSIWARIREELYH